MARNESQKIGRNYCDITKKIKFFVFHVQHLVFNDPKNKSFDTYTTGKILKNVFQTLTI